MSRRAVTRQDVLDLKVGAGHRVRTSYADVQKFKAVVDALTVATIVNGDGNSNVNPNAPACRSIEPQPKTAIVKQPAPRNRFERRSEMRRFGQFGRRSS